MFDKEYRFRGSHAERVKQLTSVFEATKQSKLFARNIDVYTDAPLVGFLYGRRSEADNLKNPETGEVYDQHIMGDRVMNSQDQLMFNFRMIMLLDEEYETDEETRINKAFRFMGKDPEDLERFHAYVRGGIDVLYEKLIEGATEPDDYVNNLFEFLSDFNERFNADIDPDELLQMTLHS